MAKFYGRSRTHRSRVQTNAYYDAFFVRQFAKAHDQLPIDQGNREAEKRWYSASFIADQVEDYFKDLLQLESFNEENVCGCALALARRVKGRPPAVIREVQTLCQQYVEALDAELVKDESLNAAAQLVLVRKWLTDYVEHHRLGRVD